MLGSEEGPDWVLTALTTPERFELVLTLRYTAAPVPVKPEAVHALLAKSKVVIPEDQKPQVDRLIVELLNPPKPFKREFLFRGHPAVDGEDAPVEWHLGLSEEESPDEDRTDFYNVTKFANVDKGAVIATVGEPGAGTDGVNVHGKTVRAKPGNPRPILAGSNTRFLKDRRTIVAESDGAVQTAGNVVFVSPLFHVDGDLDFRVGNVDFNGVVRVEENVLDGFKIKASKDVYVGRNIEAAEVVSEASVHVGGGITAHGKGRVRAGGDIFAKYVNGAHLVAGGNVIVAGEIVNSTVEAGGRIVVDRGGIIGGSISAYEHLRTAVIGSPMGVKTSVTVGVDAVSAVRIQEIDYELDDVQTIIRKVENTVGPYVDQPESMTELPPEKQEILKKLILQVQEHKDRRDALREERNALSSREEKDRKGVPFIQVSKCLYSGSDLQVGSRCRHRVVDDVQGPVRLRANEEKGTVELSWT